MDNPMTTPKIREESEIEQWDLPFGAKVRLSDGNFITFKKMDGMYAQWMQNGEMKIGNFEGFKKVEGKDFYEIINKQ